MKSTFAGETLAATMATDELYPLKELATQCLGEIEVHLRTDCKSLYDHVKWTKGISEKRLQVEISILKEMLHNGELTSLTWVDTKAMLADMLTKCKRFPQFYEHFKSCLLPS